MLGDEIVNLALADAMLSGAGAPEAERPLDQTVEEGLHLAALLGVGGVDQRHDVEIAVAHMADDGGEQPQAIDIRACFCHATRKHRDRHADVGRDQFGARPQAFLGTAHVKAGELIPGRLLAPTEIQQILVNRTPLTEALAP